MLVQQVLWIVTIVYAAWATEEIEFITLGMMMLTVYWFFVGILVCGEARELSPRVLREWPSTYATRMLLSWWMPGPGTGFMFCLSTAMAGMITLAAMGLLAWSSNVTLGNSGTSPIYLILLNSGYLFGYLGLVRLISMPMLKRWGPTFVPPIIVGVLLLFLGVVGPSVVDVVLAGRVSGTYNPLHASNWFWTWEKTFNSQGLRPIEVSLMVFIVGTFILAVNLILLFREFKFQRVAVPDRVTEDKREQRLAEAGTASADESESVS